MKIKEQLPVSIFFLILMATGLSVVDDYGISWDEYRNRANGFLAYNYMVHGDERLFTYENRQYGTAFELPLVILEKILRPESTRSLFMARHYATFLFFWFSCVVFYFLSRKLFNHSLYAFIAVGMLVISPRIFAHAFYNSKDIVFMGMFIVAFYTMMMFMEKRTVAVTVMHAAASAYLMDIRVAGIVIPFFTLFWVFVRFVHERRILLTLKGVSLYLIGLISFTVMFWPYLWRNPLTNFLEAFMHMGWHPNIMDTLYRGAYVWAYALPWHYLPVWILITVPLVYSLLFFVGAIGIGFEFVRKWKRFLLERTDIFLVLVWFFGPLILVNILGSILYDAWRQMFFIYPAFVIIGVAGIKKIWDATLISRLKYRFVIRILLVFFLAGNMTVVMGFMVKYHPYGNVYFNIIAGRDYNNIKRNYEMDYWGLFYRRALEKILEIDKRERITVFTANDPGKLNAFILPEKDRRRIWFVETVDRAEYFITNYRWRPEPYKLENEIFSVKVKGAKIVSVFKLGAECREKLKADIKPRISHMAVESKYVGRVVAIARRLSPEYLATVALQLDPKNILPVVERLPDSLLADIIQVLIKKQAYRVPASFTDVLDTLKFKNVITKIDDADSLFRIVRYMRNKDNIVEAAVMLPDDYLLDFMRLLLNNEDYKLAADIGMRLDSDHQIRILNRLQPAQVAKLADHYPPKKKDQGPLP